MTSLRETEIGLGSALLTVVAISGPVVVHIIGAVLLAVFCTAASKLVSWRMDQWHDRTPARMRDSVIAHQNEELATEISKRLRVKELSAKNPEP